MGRQHGPRYWLVPMGVLVISLLTALLVERLYESSHRQQGAAISLVQIEEEINEE